MAVQQLQIQPGSKNIQMVSYDDQTGDLFICFVRGNAIYKYPTVPLNVAEGFVRSGQSAGAYFRQNILNQYTADRVG